MESLNSSSLGAMGSLLKNLKKLLPTDEAKLKELVDHLHDIRTKLEKLTEVHDPPLTVKYWMNDARELSYDVEVCVDQFAHGIQSDTKPDKVPSIEDILGFTTRVQEVNDRWDRYNLSSRCVPDSPTKLIVRYHPQTLHEEPKLVDPIGMEDLANKFLLDDWLKPKSHGQDDLSLKVVSVLGDGGVGKSTLVTRLWRESEGKFDCRAFVHMAKKPDMIMILRSILSQFRQEQPSEAFKFPNLIHDLRNHLGQHKRYFIIIDDLWDVSVWHIVRRAFPKGNYRVLLIITTVVEKVAQACCSYDRNNIVNVKRLQDDQSKKLFVDRAIGFEEGCPSQFNGVIDKITRKCGGLPLAIICTARLVASQPKKEQKQVLDYVNKFLPDNLGTHSSSMEILNQVLKLCYSSLPHCLKTCLLYLSVYPENYLFLKEDLVKQWIAEDFISTSPEEKDAVDIAGCYFEELVNLGLIQKMDITNPDRKRLLFYILHPVVFDFITCKSIEDNFITIMDYSQSSMVITEKIRRLSLHFGSATYATIPASIGLSQVRSLAFMGLLGCMPSLQKFKLVKVVILHTCGDDGNMRFSLVEVSKLDLVRYLQVRSNVPVDLPDQMQCLKFLETLEINAEVSAVPSDILHIPRIMHICLGRKRRQKNVAQGPVASTQLTFPGNLMGSKLSHPVQVFELLPPICSFSSLPGWISRLSGLRIFEVVVRELGKYHLDHLGKLPVLTVLSLYVQKPATERITFHPGASFPALEHFKFVSGLLLLSFPEKAMPKLQRLKIRFNLHGGEKYSDMLHGMHHLKNLEKVVARIGTASGAEEPDVRKAAESAFEGAIKKVERLRSTSGVICCDVRCVDKVDEEYGPSQSSNVQCEILEETQDEEPIEQADIRGKLPTGKDDSVATPSSASPAARRQSMNEVWKRLGPTSNTYSMSWRELPGRNYMLAKLRALLEEDMVPPHIRHNIDRLRGVLEVLQHAIQTGDFDGVTADWFNLNHGLVCDIEDWADLFSLSIGCGSGSGSGRVRPSSWFSGFFNRFIYMAKKRLRARHDFSAQLEHLTLRVQHLVQQGWSRQHTYDVPLPMEAREMMPHKHINRRVGQDGSVNEVINMLMDTRDEAKFKIISIVGMVGSGKTTLAETVYQQLKGEFGCSAFFSVGQLYGRQWNLEDLIIPQLEIKDQESTSIGHQETPIKKLQDLPKNMRYLIVVDDLWSSEDWEAIKHCFPWNNLHSRIIITTRNYALALHCSSGLSDCIYKIGLLSDADSKQLFLSEVFGTEHGCPNKLEDDSAEILKKCGGLPLAIVRAAMLAHGQPEDEWRTICSNLLSSSDDNYMWQRLNLSYNDLPHNLKTCMLYLSIFPEYYEVNVERLVRLWIAEGFINEEMDTTMEETARSYLDGLIFRNMVLPLHVNHHGIPKYCVVHPVIYHFIAHKSREEKFIATMNDQHQDMENNYGTIRRLSLQSSSKQDQHVAQDSSMDLSHVRSIIVIGHASTLPRLIDLRLVRVLDLEGCDGTAVWLDGLHKLQLLRYLSLRGTDVSEIPETIGQLRFLQTLDVTSTNVKTLPRSIVILKKLMHLLCGNAMFPHGISKTSLLRTLSGAIVTDSSRSIRRLSELLCLEELELFCDFTQMPRHGKQISFHGGRFKSLKKLCIRCNSASASLVFGPSALPMVEVLELGFDGILSEESIVVSGIEHLLKLKHVLLEFAQPNAGAMETVDAVKAAGALHTNHVEVTVNVAERPLDPTIK